ncbi:MAG: MgtC/SapB family protein [Rhodobacteraceae bacterium]|nr:MgtC/SapB family protein [Paracoccaceae bacterium]
MLTDHIFGPVFNAMMIDVFVAILCGGAIGLERQLRRRPAGLRVCIIVTLTCALFVTLADAASPEDGDVTRIMAGIVTGVGFLGAGVIFSNAGQVQGITTASLIWALAAIGMTIGLGYPVTAIITTALFMLLIIIIGWAERRFRWLMPEAESQHKD